MKYVICPQCESEVPETAITCPFCKFGILVYLEEQKEAKEQEKEKQ
ncbi:MAG: hypothetical protein IJA10_14570 [Lachnospiraceae bacterium]|nr:hypothetical protein [Lachnospiraceae bacterium]